MATIKTSAGLESRDGAAFLALAAGAVAMGISPIFVRFAAPEVGPFASAFWRVALALPLLYAWTRIEDARGARRTAWFGPATVLAGLAFSGDLFFWHLAILNTTIANATFFATTAPVFVVLITWLVLRRRVSPGTWLGLALCCLGGAALIGQTLDVAPSRLEGDLYGIATAMFFALYFLAVGRARQGSGAAEVTFASSVVTALILLVVALADARPLLPQTMNGALALLAMAWISHAAGQGLLALALGRLAPVFSSLVIFLEAIAAAGFGWIILGEHLTPIQVFGGALILCGIWIARPRENERGRDER